ncbi:hypothetical protein HanXRQr2_Chr05g0223741 [Helianthus annuus]|uniref:Uncharacterized protein n=1 Tax=Helianthus annuus TaxID=4232 RepID=A0A9K3J0G0_HELAN|nr:hypothetical protein HanXRQr2_Chr05g0223741 [Helianthus annuus]
MFRTEQEDIGLAMTWMPFTEQSDRQETIILQLKEFCALTLTIKLFILINFLCIVSN